MLCRLFLIVALLSTVVLTLRGQGNASDNGAKDYFKSGEKLLKAGQVFEAYGAFQAAAKRDPSKKKYAAKMNDAGKAAAVRAQERGHAALETDMAEARIWFQAAVGYDNTSSSAAQAL